MLAASLTAKVLRCFHREWRKRLHCCIFGHSRINVGFARGMGHKQPLAWCERCKEILYNVDVYVKQQKLLELGVVCKECKQPFASTHLESCSRRDLEQNNYVLARDVNLPES